MSQSLAQRSVTSFKWNSLTSIAQIVLGFGQSVMLARLLPVETFGVYTGALATVALIGTFADFGLDAAFLHRSRETEDMDEAAAILFTLELILAAVVAALLIAGTLLFTGDQNSDLRIAFLVITITHFVLDVDTAPRLILVRQVQHRRLALLKTLSITLTAFISVALALGGATIWALLSSEIISAVLYTVGFYFWRPVWRPRLAWSTSGIRYFLSFGSRNLIATFLLNALDRVDDIWSGFFLGAAPLGFYSRAYRFARIPSNLLAAPMDTVVIATYAELKEDRYRLSLSFSHVNVLMIRSGFFMAGLLAVTAPEFIRIILGERWLPMLDVFRLMLIFTLFDPMKRTIANLFTTAVGKPELVIRVRLIQLIIMVAGLFILGLTLGIVGVALAVDIMLVAGIGILLWHARTYVDFSIRELFLIPALALVAALITGEAAGSWSAIAGADWASALVKFVVFGVVYSAVLLIWDRKQIKLLWQIARQYLFK